MRFVSSHFEKIIFDFELFFILEGGPRQFFINLTRVSPVHRKKASYYYFPCAYFCCCCCYYCWYLSCVDVSSGGCHANSTVCNAPVFFRPLLFIKIDSIYSIDFFFYKWIFIIIRVESFKPFRIVLQEERIFTFMIKSSK